MSDPDSYEISPELAGQQTSKRVSNDRLESGSVSRHGKRIFVSQQGVDNATASKTFRVTYCLHVYQSIDVTVAVQPDATDEQIAALAQPHLAADLWEPSGDSADIELNGIDLIEEYTPAVRVRHQA